MYGKECPTCHERFDDPTIVCPKDGASLVAAEAPPANDPDVFIGMVVAKQYRIVERIGEGSVSVVYRARQESVGRDVAVKVLRRRFQKNDSTVRRFETEAKVISQLRHPNTVKLVDFHRSESNDLFIITELLSGQSLRDLLNQGPLPLERVLRVAMQLCGALAEAHVLGIVHRDLKPENIMIDRVGGEDHIRVLDFGIAKLLVQDSLQTHANTIVGTPAYMAPEQSQSSPPDQRADLYSLGVMMHEMITGKPPFMAETSVGVMVQHIGEAPKPVSALAPPGVVVPAELEALILELLAKNRDDRPAKSEDVRERLSRVWSAVQRHIPTDLIPRLKPISRDLPPFQVPFRPTTQDLVGSENPTDEVPLPPPATIMPAVSTVPSVPGNGAVRTDSPAQLGPLPSRVIPRPNSFALAEAELAARETPLAVPKPRAVSTVELGFRERLPVGRILLALALFSTAIVVLVRYLPFAERHDVVLVSKRDPAQGEPRTAEVTLTSEPDRADVFSPSGAFLGSTSLRFMIADEGMYLIQSSDGRRGSVHLDPKTDKGKTVHVVLQPSEAPSAETVGLGREPQIAKPPHQKPAKKAVQKPLPKPAPKPEQPVPEARPINDNPIKVDLP